MADDFDPDAYLGTALPDAPQAQAPDAQAFDPDAYIKDFDPDAYLDAPASGRPAAETPLATGVREGAHAVVPGLGALAGMGYGAAVGSPGGPVGAFAGAVVGGVAAGLGVGWAQEKGLEALGFDDAEQRAANEAENPNSALAGQIAGGMVGMSPSAVASPLVKGAANQLIQRGAGGAFGGVMEAGHEAFEGEGFSAKKIGANMVAGAVMPGVNRVGQKFVDAGAHVRVPGRPNVAKNPAAEPAHEAVGDTTAEIEVGDSSLAQSPPTQGEAQIATTGNPQSAPERSPRDYGKGKAPAGAEGDMLTQGDIKPDVAAALQANPDVNPNVTAKLEGTDVNQPIPGFDDHPSGVGQPERRAQPVQSEEGLIDASRAQREALGQAERRRATDQTGAEPSPAELEQPFQDRPAAPVGPPKAQAAIARSKKLSLPQKGPEVVETGFPKPGEPVAVGENEATPVAARAMPELKGEAPINDTVTDAQKAAGNYPKARSHDFGKPMAAETHAGDTRRGTSPTGEKWEVKLPYDYGYFNKTKGADKDHIDWARPPEGSAAKGDKHFIVDQRNAETGKFDEHKVFNYYKDEAAARADYEAGFSDGKGSARLGAITEVTRPELVKFLAKHTSRAANKPYGALESAAPKAASKPVAERAVIKDLIAKAEAAGDTAKAEAIRNAPEEKLAAAAEGKRLRKYGTSTGNSAGYPVEGVTTADGRPVTANTKAKAAERSDRHTAVKEWFQTSTGKRHLDYDNEPSGSLLNRIKTGLDTLNGYDAFKTSKLFEPGSWVPSHKPREWLWAREANNLLKKPTPGAIKKFREAERLLKGSDEAVDNYRGGNRVDADIARSKRSGDEAVANAEAKNVDLGVNTAEDEMIARIDAKRGGKFDVPHEEAENEGLRKPVKTAADIRKPNDKTVDVSESSLARKAEAAKLAGKKSTKAAGTESEGAASKPREIKVVDEAEKERIMAALQAATKKAASRDAALDITAPVDRPGVGKGMKDLLGNFINDESGAGGPKGDMKSFIADIHKALATTDHQTYIAKKSAGPVDDYARSLSDDLHKLSQENRNHLIGALHKLADLPKELNSPKVMEMIYHARDADSAGIKLPAGQTGTHVDNLPPKVKAAYDKHLKEWFDQNDQFVKNIQAIDPDRIGPDVQHHISRITKGDTSQYNMLKSKDDPTSPQYNGISVNAAAAKLRKFYALENSAGDRVVIQPDGNGFKIWRNHKLEKVKAPDFEFEDGGTFTVNTKDGKTIPFTMRQATTKEIEANARGGDGAGKPMRYYKNAGFSAAVTNVQLGAMARHLQELQRLSQTKEFGNLSTTNRATADERGWKESNLPNFKGRYFHPEVLHVLNDFAGHLETPYSQLNSAITKLLFWMPTAHLANVGHHWVVGRGWDNFLPSGIKSFVTDTPKAIMSVIRQDDFQMQLRREGAGTIQGSVLTRDMMPKIAKALKMEIENEPSKWGPIADKLGVPLQKLGSAVYDASSKVMWAGNDMFITQRVMELMRKGMTMKQAIIDAERDIPNYRMPTKIIMGGEKGRQLQQIASDPRILSFGRYHYGLMNSYANIVKDALGKSATAGDRLEAVGKLMAMGMLGLAVFPLMDMLQKKMTGNEGASQQRRGPISVPHHIAEAAEGKADVMAAVRATATIPPLYQTLLETLQNKDFRGKQIVEPGDFKNAVHGSPVAAGRVAAQTVGHAVRGLVSPINTLSNSTKKDVTPLGMLRDQATDAKNPSAKAVKYEKLINMHNQRDTLQRFKGGGSDPLEAAYNRLFGYK